MTTKRQQPTTDEIEEALRHEINTAADESRRADFTARFTAYGKTLGLDLNESFLSELYAEYESRWIRQLLLEVNHEQFTELGELMQANDLVGIARLMRTSITRPRLHQIEQEEARRIEAQITALSLQQTPKSAKDITSMEFDTQEIIEQAQAEGTRQAETATHPEPDTRAELGAIATEATRLDEVLAELRNRDIPLTATEVETAISGLRTITQHSNQTAWHLGLHAVERGLISQARLAELLGASQATVSRRYREGVD